MPNERLRDSILEVGLTLEQVADKAGVDPKTVERWTTNEGRVPYPRHRRALAVLLGRSESYLWPSAVPPERQATIASSEIVKAYPYRNAIPQEVWDRLFHQAVDRIDILVHAGQFLVENPDFIGTLAEKASKGVTVRIAFGDPNCEAVALRSGEEHLGEGVLAARIRYGLVAYTPLQTAPGIEFRFHGTTLYNSIFRFDEEMIVNTHIYGAPGAHAPAMHLRKLGAGNLFAAYVASFTEVWSLANPAVW
jgi:transcriptional regulator with XRE-family HTH domain